MKPLDLIEYGKILYTTPLDISLPEGASVNEREFCWGLQRLLKNRVQFLVQEPKRNIDEIRKYQISFIKGHDLKNFFQFLLGQIDYSKKLRQVASSGHFDLIVTRFGLLPVGFLCGIRKCNTPLAVKHFVGRMDIGAIHEKKFMKYLKKMSILVHLMLIRKILHRIIAADTPTDSHLKSVLETYKIDPKKIIQIENATNTSRFRPIDKWTARSQTGLERFDPIIGYVGGRPWERGGHEMVAVAPRVIRHFPKAGFVIIGGGQGMAPLLQRIRFEGLEPFFYCPGVIDYELVPVYINAFDIGIAFDRKDRLNSVGNSNQKVRQYIACGKPSFVTPGGNDFIVSNRLGAIIDFGNIDHFFDELYAWLSMDDESISAHSIRASKYAADYLSIEKAVFERVIFWNEKLFKSELNL